MRKQVVIKMRDGKDHVYEGERMERDISLITLYNGENKHEIYIGDDVLSVEIYDV